MNITKFKHNRKKLENMTDYNNKFNVMFIPNTLQLAYMKMKNQSIDIDVLKFTDGSIRVTIPSISEDIEHHTCEIYAYVNSMDDLMIVAQIKDIVQRVTKCRDYRFVITSPMYSRYDRVMLDGQIDSFGAKVFADFINSMKFDTVNLFDNHSEVLTNLIDRGVNLDQSFLVKKAVGEYLYDKSIIIAPDKGACKKLANPDIVFDKVRDLATGKILGIEAIKIATKPVDKPCLVVDDLCEGGGTFIGLGNKFKEMFPNHKSELNLYVTHGIFSNNAIEKLLNVYDNIYVQFMTESKMDEMTHEQHSRVHITQLVSA